MNSDDFVAGCVLFILGFGFPIFMLLMTFIKFSGTGIGMHTGYITAIEQEGYIWRNYRVYVKTDLSSSQEDIYCMQENRKDLADKLNVVRKQKIPVTIKFNGVRGLGTHLCNDIEIIDVEDKQ